jgi:hypothetical protein
LEKKRERERRGGADIQAISMERHSITSFRSRDQERERDINLLLEASSRRREDRLASEC